MIKFNINILFRSFISLFFLLAALYFLDWMKIKQYVSFIHLNIFILTIIFHMVVIAILSLRWYCLINSIVKLPVIDHIERYLYSLYLNIFTPANVGSDIYRVVSLKKNIKSSLPILIIIFKEHFIGLLSHLFFYIICIIGLWYLSVDIILRSTHFFLIPTIVILMTAASLLFTSVIIRFFLNITFIRSHDFINKTLNHILKVVIFSSKSEFFILIGLSFLAFIIRTIIFQQIAINLNIEISSITLGVFFVLVELARMIPLSIQGIGVREAMWAYMIEMLGGSSEKGFVLGTVVYISLSIAMMLSGLIGWGLIYFRDKNSYNDVEKNEHVHEVNISD